ncbi:class I adenylate-forming enzyme family protein [Pseudohaliea rubra]|uniref:Long-chain-fatty-acid--CoA ligase n=1 Tax=Pseudohaliea rubra DSM 19751 TaxID=1265313 RepID=A0A095WYC6_9GAMM|nr:class I adenylate-forming enzyme family protein [Pseudohaliea rubra]KGE03614.1 Long-chain-fatty-acid--CoA ligase [Pseudohaliea rubra DSM 19751]
MKTSTAARIAAHRQAGHWADDTLHSLLAGLAGRAGDRPAVIDPPNSEALGAGPPRRLDFSMLDRESNGLARELAARGIGPGDALLVQLPNTHALVLLYVAASKLGAVLSPLAVQYGLHEIAGFASALSPRAFISQQVLGDRTLLDDGAAALPGIDAWPIDELLAGAAARDQTRGNWADDADAILTVCWTSGTTGTPKGVPRSHNMWSVQGRTTQTAGGYRPGEVLLAPFPFVNMAALGGFLFPMALLGCTVVLHHPLDPALYLAQLQDESVNFTIAPPALLNRLAQQPALWEQFDFSALRAVGSGSVPLSPAMIEAFEGRYGKPVVNFYGSNEGIALFATPETAPAAEQRAKLFPRLGVAGMPFTGYGAEVLQTRVIDPASGAPINEPGASGELCIAGPGVFDGYLGHDNRGLFSDDGFFRTGDLVEISGAPPLYYRIVGRCKDIINRGGMKLSPSELDTLLEGHPDLAEAAVCSYADPELGERICACLVLTDGASAPTIDALGTWLSERGLARFKAPERIELFDTLPRNPLGKVVRDELVAAVAARGDTL